MTVVVAIVPALDRVDSIAETVRALQDLAAVDRVLVVDDGSTDGTAAAAAAAGASVLRLPENRGKGGAVLAGVAAAPDAEVVLLIDADLAATASAADVLLGPVLAGTADLTIGVLPPAGGRGGFGKVRDLASRGIRRACGLEVRAPLSGQRAVRADLLRGLVDAERFGLEVAMTIDAQRTGARILEVDVPMDHLHRGRSVAGFAHRAGQGVDIVRALWPRVTSPRQRRALVLLGLVLAIVASSFAAIGARPESSPATGGVDRVVLFGMPRISLGDLDSGAAPNLSRLARAGAYAAMSVRTIRDTPDTADAYATISAGTRVRTVRETSLAFSADQPIEGSTAREVTERRTGLPADGELVVVGAAATVRAAGEASSAPGALGDAIAGAGLTAGVVGNADGVSLEGVPVLRRPAAVGAMQSSGSVDIGSVSGAVLVSDHTAPFGRRVDTEAFLTEARRTIASAELTILDPGELDRAYGYGAASSPEQYERLREHALRRTDELLGAVVADLPPATMLLVVGLTPPSTTWELTPLVVHGAGVVEGHLRSPSTQRPGLVAITDISSTVLDALGVAEPAGMIGRPLEYQSGTVDLGRLERMNEVAVGRERVYLPVAVTFILVQALVYLVGIVVLALTGRSWAPFLRFLRFAVVTFAAWPVATFLVRIVPALMTLDAVTHVLIWAVAVAIAAIAVRRRGHPLAALQLVAVLTVAVVVLDVSTGSRLLQSSILGYSPHTSSRFSGLGNTAYAVLAACALIAVVVRVDRSPRRADALAGAAAFLAFVIVLDGAPWLGADVGGILSLVPVGALLIAALRGRPVRPVTVAVALGATALVLGAAIGVDLLRAPSERSHLANFVVDSVEDRANVSDTLARRWSSNFRVLESTVWTWLVPVITVFGVYVLVIARGWRRLLPPGSALRAGVVGLLATGLLGWLVNDSGVVITSLFLVFLAPYLTLIVIADRSPGPELLEPDPVDDGNLPKQPGAPVVEAVPTR